MARDLPSGTVTFLFTDIEESTRLLRELGDDYAAALAEHRRVLRDVFARQRGVEVDTQGDAFFYAFSRASDAVAAAAEAQHALLSGPVRVRIGLHTGEPTVTDEGYVGLDVHTAARIAAAAHGGQVVLSQATHELVDTELRDLGLHRLKDLLEPQRLFQLGDGEFPPLRTPYQTNLPMPTTPFLGRKRELRQVMDLLTDDAVRLLTLAGAGGSGKTRLALQCAAGVAEHYPDGSFWVALAPVRDPRLALPAIAAELGAAQDLVEHIGQRRMLVLIDNFEHVLDAAGELAALLDACPRLDLLVTSREALHVSAERVFVVLQLADPDGELLFRERARAVHADLAADAEVGEICRRLDGLPLAIELAAARANVLSTNEILQRLDSRLPLLTGGPRDAPARQQTLRATIEWSYELLDAQEQLLFRRLGIFVGGCTLDAAREICNAELDLLASLIDKNLLNRRDDRYWMFETIREYALERLEKQAHDELLEALAGHLLALGEVGPYPVIAATPSEVREKLAHEVDNFRAAVEWALAERHAELALRLAIAARGSSSGGLLPAEQSRWLDEGLEAATGVSPETRARALHAGGLIAFVLGDFAKCLALAEQSLQLFRELGDDPASAETLVVLGNAVTEAGDLDRARAIYEEASRLATRVSYEKGIYRALHALGELELTAGDLARAAELLEESARLATKAGNRELVAFIRHGLGDVALQKRDLPRAAALYRQGLQLAEDLKLGRGIVGCVAGLAVVAAATGEVPRAGRLWGAVEMLEHETGFPIRGRHSPWYEEIIGSCSAVAPIAFEAAAEDGRRMTPDEAIAYAHSDGG